MIRDILKRILKTLQIPLTENLAIDIQTEKIVKQLAGSGRIKNCVDVGVLDREILELFLKYIPDGTHSGVEPIPEKFELLKAKFKLNKNINLHNFAAGSKEEESKIGRAPSELQSRENLVCRLLLEKKKI